VNTSSYGRVVSAVLLTRALKRLRQASGQQHKQVADALEWSVSKLIRIEGATIRISRTDLEALLRYYGVSDLEEVDELTAWAREARVPGWWERFRILDEAFERYVAYEAGAASIRMVQELLVPGILQTEEYARLITSTYAAREDVDSVVQLRLERQEEVFARTPEQHHILDEAVLRRRVGDAMPRQLRHLIELAARPEVTIRVIPLGAGPHFGMKGPFVLLGFDVPLGSILFMESGWRSDLIVREEETCSDQILPGVSEAAEVIAAFEDGFSGLNRIALDEAGSAALIERIARENALLLLRGTQSATTSESVAAADSRWPVVARRQVVGQAHALKPTPATSRASPPTSRSWTSTASTTPPSSCAREPHAPGNRPGR
jgi:transcriptional regulator with XRE-family HTH domain